MKIKLLLILPVVLCCALTLAANAQPGSSPPGYGWFPFVLPPFDASPTVTDVSWLNQAPAGRSGFIGAKGAHFVDGNGEKIRFWGVNISFSGAFPSKEKAPLIAARLAKYGFNAVRLHNYEGYAEPKGLWVPAMLGSSRVKIPREMDPKQLDKLDYFVAQLIKRGIYVNFNLHVGREVLEDEGVANTNQLPDKDKGVDYYDDALIDLQKEFARQILEHKNPYTGRTYAQEPGVCAVEVSNEDSLVGLWLKGALNQLPQKATFELEQLWNEWLKDHYNEKTLKTAWHESSEPLNPVDILALPLPPSVINPNAPDSRILIGLATMKRFQFQDADGAGTNIKVDELGGPTVNGFVRPGMSLRLWNQSRHPWGFRINRDGLDLRQGEPYTLTFWARSSNPRRMSVSLWQDRAPFQFEGFTGYADLGYDWRKYSFVFRPNEVDPGHSRLSFNFGKSLGEVQLGEMQLHAGGQLSVPKNWTLEQGVPLIDIKTTQVWRARSDFAKFLGEVERRYAKQMLHFLKDELKVQCPVWISQAQFGALGGLLRESNSDAIDVHAYWKHPVFSGGGWSGKSWTVGNVSMTTMAGDDPLAAFAHLRLADKPFVMSEWNSGQPSNFGAETLLMAAAYASWQDWAGVYLFDYHSNGDYSRDAISGFFSIDSNPAKMITAPAAALMFRRGDVTAAREHITLTVPKDEVWQSVANSPGPPAATPFLRLWENAGASAAAALNYGASIQFGNVAFPTVSRASRVGAKSTFITDTGELTWTKNPASLKVNSSRSKAVVGFSGADPVILGEWQVTSAPGHYRVIALSSLDGKPVPASRRLLVTALRDAQNKGTRWTAANNSVTNWGNGPTYVRGVNAQISLLTNHDSLKVWALDATGERRAVVPSKLQNGKLTFDISPQWQTAWYEISAAP